MVCWCYKVFKPVYDHVQMTSAMLSKQRRVDAISEPTITAGEPMSINRFSDEILLKVLSYCGPEVLGLIIPEVCRRWNALSKDVTLWKALSYSCDGTAEMSCVEQVRCAKLLWFQANVNLCIMAEVSRKCLSTIWLVTDSIILLTVHTTIHITMICFPLHPHSTAGKTAVYSSVILCWLELPSFVLFLKFAGGALLKLILFIISALMITTKYIQLLTVLVSSPSEKIFTFLQCPLA
jgi:hypothetical protein